MLKPIVRHRIDGLESNLALTTHCCRVRHRIDGLEIRWVASIRHCDVRHRIDGLEIAKSLK